MELDAKEVVGDEWLVQPCEWYKEEYRDCKSIKARFHQYFTNGKVHDCSDWYQDYNNCMKWRKSKDHENLPEILENERRRRKERLKGTEGNDVWQLRKEPPKDWDKPLPDWLIQKHTSSILHDKSLENYPTASKASSDSCVIL